MLDRLEPPDRPSAGARPLAGTVSVRYWAAAREATGVEAQDVPPGPLGEVLAALLAQHPRLRPVLRVCSVFVDGAQVAGAGARAAVDADSVREPGPQLSAGSTLEILPPFAGG